MEVVASGVVDQAAGSCFALAMGKINKMLSYILHYKDNMDDIRSQRNVLEMLKKEIEQRVLDGERKLETIVPLVDDCLKDADEFLADDKWSDFTDENKIREKDRCCFSLVQMNLKYRYLVSRRAVKKSEITKEKITKMKDCSSRAVTLPKEPPKLGSMPTVYSKSLASRESTLKEIMEALKDKEVRVIGIYGMGGVGKTTLIEEVARQAEADGLLFSEVVMVEVSQAPDVSKIQQHIAERIGLPLQDSKSDDERARKIHERLKKKIPNEAGNRMLNKGGKQVVVILDNIWEKLDLDIVGIPRDCKITLTTRSEHVCQKMGADKTFEVRGLNDTEATELFLETAGRQADHDDSYKSTTSELVKKCGGLPLAIAALANTLRGRDLLDWKGVVAELERPVSARVGGAIEEKVYPVLEWSYNFISGDEKKKFLLLCCLFPLGSSIAVQDLMRYGAGLDLFQYKNSLGEALAQANSWIVELKSSSLLLEADDKQHVKIHDVVRETLMSVASKGGNVFQIGSFPRLLTKEAFESYTIISMEDGDNYKPLSWFKFPKLEMLLLKGGKSNELSINIFQGMERLKILVMSDMKFQELPKSDNQLKNLRMLHLERCDLSDISAITELTDLLFLSLRESIINGLPTEFKNLVNLKLLDLTKCSMPQNIPVGVIDKLTELEELYMMDCFQMEGQWAFLKDLKSLSYLAVLEIHVPNISLLPDDLLFPHLSQFLISIGNTSANWFFDSNDDFVRISQWKLYSQILLLEDIVAVKLHEQSLKCLLKKTECLILMKIIGLTSVTDSLVNDGFRNLKCLYVRRCNGMKYIVSTNELNEESIFPKLEELYVRDMSGLEGIYHGPDLHDYFYHLKKVYLYDIHSLQSFWDNHDVQNSQPFFNEEIKFSSLEELTIVNACGIKELWHFEDVEKEVPAFPKLVYLMLSELPQLMSIWRSNDIIMHSNFQNLKVLQVEYCASLEMLCPLSVAVTLKQLDYLIVGHNGNMKEIIAKETGEMKNNDMTIFPKLRNMCLEGLDKLKYFFGGSIKFVFPSLESIRCNDLKEMVTFVISDYPDNSNVLFNDKVVLPAIKDITFTGEHGLQELWGYYFDARSVNGLETINISFAKKTTKVFSLDIIKRMQNLKELTLQKFQSEEFIEFVGFYNDEVEKLALLPQLRELVMDSFHQLKRIPWKELALKNLRYLKISENDRLTSLFSASVCRWLVNLEKLDVSDCSKMKEIVGRESGDIETVRVEVIFLHLNFLRLSNLLAFRSLGSDIIFEFPSIEGVDFDNFQNQILLNLLQKFQHVKELRLGRCKALLESFDHGGDATKIPPRLRKLTLYSMPDLERIKWMVFPIRNLRYLKISKVDTLKFLFQDSECSKEFERLEEIHVDNCKNIEEVFAQKSSEDISNNAAPTTIILPSVKIIRLINLQSLCSFSSSNYRELKFPSLEEVEMDCPKISKFSYESPDTPRLCKIKLNGKYEEKCSDINEVIKKWIKQGTSRANTEGQSIEGETSGG